MAALLPAGCEDSPTLLPIDSVVELRAAADTTGRLTISGQTQHLYGCLGYQIIHKDFNQSGGFLRPNYQIDLLGVQAPAPSCAAVQAPATSISGFLMPPPGTHTIRVTANGVVAVATLEVTPDSLIVTGGNGIWTLWPEPRVARP